MKTSAGISLVNPGTDAAIEDQLELLKHAESCEIGKKKDGAEQCKNPRCFRMRKILEHLKLCNRGESCALEGCYATRQLNRHSKKCHSLECRPCRNVERRSRLGTLISPPQPVNAITAKRRLHKQLMEFILHIHKCRPPNPEARIDDCGLENCEVLERTMLHFGVCGDRETCPFPSCVASKFVLHHWRICPRGAHCLLCEPLSKPEFGLEIRPKPKQRYFATQHVEQLYHTLTCLDRDENTSQNMSKCPQRNCERMKELLLDHLPQCKEERCPRPQCSSSKRIVRHWQECSHADCPCCTPEKRMIPEGVREIENRPKPVSNVPPLPEVYPPNYEMQPLKVEADQVESLRGVLVFLLHAHKCASTGMRKGAPVKSFPCRFEHCQLYVELYNHVLDCKIYENCARKDQCSLARQIIHHWQICDDDECAMCFPLTDTTRESKQSEAVVQSQTQKDADRRDGEMELDENQVQIWIPGPGAEFYGNTNRASVTPMEENQMEDWAAR